MDRSLLLRCYLSKSMFIDTCLFYFREFPRQIVATLLLLLLAGAVESIGAVSIVPLLSALIDGNASNPLMKNIEMVFSHFDVVPSLTNVLVIICAAMVGRAVIFLLAYKQVGYVEAEVATRLRTRLLGGLLRANWSYYIKQPAGKLTYALSTESTLAGRGLRILALALSHIIQAVVYLGVASFFSWQIVLAGIACGSLMMFSLNFLIKRIRAAGLKQTNALNAMNAIFTDALAGVKPLKVMNVERLLVGHIEDQSEQFKEAARKSAMGMGLMSSIQEPFTTVLVAGGLYVGYVLMKIDAALILVMAFYFHRILSRVSSFQQTMQNYGILEGNLISLIGKINEINSQSECRTGKKSVDFQSEVGLRDVSLSYGDRDVLRNFNLSVPMNRITALCGPSGVGKTTTIDLIVGLVRPDEGEVLVDGVPLSDLDMNAWREQIGYVPQEVFLFNDTIRMNITLGRDVEDEEVWRAVDAAGARDFVETSEGGLDGFVGEQGRALSGGQRQRLMIARAVIARPRLLVLDEATSGLDEKTEKSILDSIVRLKDNMAVLIVSHQQAVRTIADEVIVYNGQKRELEG
ncbi:ATP-binding cassette domain-containing protein [Pseudodesulfovibrio cashew]|uniref:ATP-binding cassette domain-containing protein n=1 Tax=Pseudodesulfovibrio cashew TaxID=2678688 RepID=A0A6I6JMT3_9BACT|nr:ABC transporter ATP-binding protein [Pseudodesulfovibrio cashew]QGY39004.1 ATP-binding cassette domain-containing protein [Pseudodesulfovibrio cashew]